MENIRIPPEYYPAIDELPGALCWLAQRVEELFPGRGVEVAIMVSLSIGGGWHYICKMDDLLRRVLDDAIRRESDNGVLQKEIACRFGLSTRQVIRILKQPDSQEALAEKQMNLF